jgi:uncharacterized membrane protein
MEEEIKTMSDDLKLQNIDLGLEKKNDLEKAPETPVQINKDSEPSTQGEIYSLPDQKNDSNTGHENKKKESVGDILPLEKEVSFFKKVNKEIWSQKWQYLYLLISSYLRSIFRPLIALLSVLTLYIIFQTIGIPSDSLVSIIKIILGVAGILGVIWLTVATIAGFLRGQVAVILYANKKEERDTKKTIKEAKQYILPLFKTQLLQGLIVLGGTILFVIPGIIWGIKYGYASYICVLEGKGARESIKRSGVLTHGYKWTAWYLGLCLELFWFLIGLTFSFIFVLLAMSPMGGPVIAIIAVIISLLVSLFYILINFLKCPYNLVFSLNVFQNIREKKEQNKNARGKVSFWKILLVILLTVFIFFFASVVPNMQGIKEVFDEKKESVQALTNLASFSRDRESDFKLVSPPGSIFDPEEENYNPEEEKTTSTDDFINEPDQPAPIEKMEVVDSDSDGLTDTEELAYNTDLFLSDTDFDGLDDYQEVMIYKTDPLDEDSDDDTYLDGMEVDNGYNPLGSGRLQDIIVEQN